MMVSLCLAYYNRKSLLFNTLKSIEKSIHKSNVEIIVADDASDDENTIENINDLFPNLNIIYYRFSPDEKYWTCPVLPINKAISLAKGEIIIIQGAECSHKGDIIDDVINNISINQYRVYSCYNLTKNDTNHLTLNSNFSPFINNSGNWDTMWSKGGWYEHPQYNQRGFHFCTAITKTDLLELGGFDERYSKGYGFGDNEFITRVNRKNMDIVWVTDPIVYHQYHTPNTFDYFNNDPNKNLYFNTTLKENIITVPNSFFKK